MTAKKRFGTDREVGASKAAKVMLGSLDRRLIEPAAILVRISGWVIVLTVVYISVLGNFDKKERQYVLFWAIAYIIYMITLEVIRRFFSEIYETSWFRAVRIIVNVAMISILVSIAPVERHILIFAYAVPIFATVVYAAESNWIKAGVYILSLSGVYLGDIIFSNDPKLNFAHFTTYSIALAGLTLGFEVFRRRTNLVPSRLTEIVKELHKTLDLQKLMEAILVNAIDITLAHRGLILIINPRTKRYVGHFLLNFDFKPESSIDGLAKRCSVLINGQPYENPDIISAFHDKSIYHEFFKSQPRSILAEPLYNRAGQVLGVINVAHDDAYGFDKITKNTFKEFAFLVSNAIENCFEHREVNLREAKSREAGEKFVSASTEDEAINILFEEVRQQIPHAEKMTLHQFLPKNHGLLPIHSYSLETTPNIFLWSSQKPRKLKPDLFLGYGIAGHALELKDTILVPDVSLHPWFVELDYAQDIKSLLVAPLFDPQGNELYGTISLESSKLSVFSLEDESTLTYLATQSSRAIAKVRDFQAWREQGGTLRKILEQIGAFDIAGTEKALCEQIADAAANLLGFKIVRIRILSRDDMLVTMAVTGVSGKTNERLLKKDLLYSKLKPFLDQKFKAESSYLIKPGTPGWKAFVDKYFHKPRVVKHNKSGWDVYDALITPLSNQSGEVIGILTLDTPVSGSEPNKQLLELIGVFANAASWVIELSRFQRRLAEQQYRAQSFIDTISQELAKGRDLSTISEVVVQVGAKLLSAEGCSLYLVHDNEIELTHSNYLADTDFISRRKPISSQPKAGLTAWVADTGQVIYFNNGSFKTHEAWAGEDAHLQNLPSRKCNSLLLAPIKAKDNKVIGVISLENKLTLNGQKDFDQEDKERLISLANEFARALETIGLYEDIKEWERIGLADDLHDLINWYHSGVIMWIEALEEWLVRNEYQKAKQLVPELRQHALTTVLELKALHTNMLTKPLEAGSLKQALEQTMNLWTQRAIPKYSGVLNISLECPDDLVIPVKIRNTLVRIASLAFSNAIRHSGIIEDPGVSVQVNVQQRNNEIILEVIDNGKGIDLPKTQGGYGLDRMRQLSGKINNWGNTKSDFKIKTKIGMGTKVILRLTMNDTTITT